MLKELTIINQNTSDDILISGRELHEALEIKTEYKKWMNRMIDYGFIENTDFVKVTQKCLTSSTGQNITDHHLKLDMAKEIAMIQRTDLGRQYRQYFIKLEKEYKKLAVESYMIEDPIKRAERWIEEQKERIALENKLEKQKPMVTIGEKVVAKGKHYTRSTMADIVGLTCKNKASKVSDIFIEAGVLRKNKIDGQFTPRKGYNYLFTNFVFTKENGVVKSTIKGTDEAIQLLQAILDAKGDKKEITKITKRFKREDDSDEVKEKEYGNKQEFKPQQIDFEEWLDSLDNDLDFFD